MVDGVEADLILSRRLSRPEQDRWMQVFLAQARGRVRNGDLLRASIARSVQQLALRNGRQETLSMEDPLIGTLTCVADALDALNIPYAVTGSVASSVHGEPFASVDADLVLLASPAAAAALATKLSPRFYASVEMLVEASTIGKLINVIDIETSMKVDLSFVGDDPFVKQCLHRRIKGRIGSHPREFWFVTAEDVILMKLLWRKDTKSSKQWENALGVARVRGARMDWRYLLTKADELRIADDLVRLRDEAGI